MTTPEYLASLETADPDRAFEELDRFLDGALDQVLAGKLSAADLEQRILADYAGTA